MVTTARTVCFRIRVRQFKHFMSAIVAELKTNARISKPMPMRRMGVQRSEM